MVLPVSGWFGDRKGPWLPDRPRAAKKPPAAAPAIVEAAPVQDLEMGEQYAVPYLPVRCPRCRRGDCVETYSTRLKKSPPTRYHECRRCTFKFRSFEVDEGPDGGLVLHGST